MEEAESAAEQWPQRTIQQARGRPWLILLAGAGITLLALWFWSTADPAAFTVQFDDLTGTDIEQGRIDTALPPPRGSLALAQTFIPRHNGLGEVEITLLRHADVRAPGKKNASRCSSLTRATN